ncbi:MAG: hypothetical protein AB1656_22840 [Candidatus Omnitrophota bacterium]
MNRLFRIVAIIAVAALSAAAGDAPPNASPFAAIWDTGAPSAEPLAPQAISERKQWTLLKEDDLAHSFQGDAVILNDKAAIVLRKKGFGAELYSLMGSQPKARAQLAPDAKIKMASMTIVENNPGAAQIQANYSDGQSVGFRLTAGDMILEILPSPAMNRNLRIRAGVQYAIVPDYFADDMIFSPALWKRDGALLPVEQYFLNAMDDGGALIMCAWQSKRQGAKLFFEGKEKERAIGGFDVKCLEGNKIWIALLEHPHIWGFANEVKSATDWKPPFPAKWRADLLQKDGETQSSFYSEKIETATEPFFVYPIDRDRTTPLTIFCPVDVMKNTLGTGPCQYILEAEKLGSDTHPTPNAVADWVEAQFGKQRDNRLKKQLQDTFKAMIGLLMDMTTRIDRYVKLGQEIKMICLAEKKTHPDQSAVMDQLIQTIENMENAVNARRRAMAKPEVVTYWGMEIVDLLNESDPMPKCTIFCKRIRGMGDAYDYALSKGRMMMRWLSVQCAMEAERNPKAPEAMKKIQERLERFGKDN